MEPEKSEVVPAKVKKIGTREEVWNGTSLKTAGGLTKDDLAINKKTNKICAKKAIERGRKLAEHMKKVRSSDVAEEPFEVIGEE